MIHTGLAPDGTVDLREQRRWHLDEIDAAHVGRCGKAGNVAGNAAAQRDDRRIAPGARLDEPVQDGRHRCERLVGFAVGKHDGRRGC